jgi:hypothetical protein
MDSPLEVIKAAKDEAELKKRSKPVIMTIATLVSTLQDNEWDKMTTDQLEAVSGQLSGFMFTLSKEVADARLEYNAKYIFRKIRGAKLYFEVNARTQKEREKLAEVETAMHYQNELIANYYAETLEHLFKNCERIVSIAQSIMSNKRSEMKINNNQPS